MALSPGGGGMDRASQFSMRHGPRERLRMLGVASLSDEELLALLLGTGVGVGKDAMPVLAVAARLHGQCGGLPGLGRAAVHRVTAVPGVGPIKAARVVAAMELGRRAAAVPFQRQTPLLSSVDVARALGPRLVVEPREVILAVGLNTKNCPVGEYVVAQGGVSSASVLPRDVFRPLVADGATGVILVHNHPSGECAPSDEDLRFTARMAQVGETLGVILVDHVILAAAGHFSFVDAGLLPGSGGAPHRGTGEEPQQVRGVGSTPVAPSA